MAAGQVLPVALCITASLALACAMVEIWLNRVRQRRNYKNYTVKLSEVEKAKNWMADEQGEGGSRIASLLPKCARNVNS